MRITLPKICGYCLFIFLNAILISTPGRADSGRGKIHAENKITRILDADLVTLIQYADEENQPPVLSNIETQPLFYSIGAGAIVVSHTIEVSDPDNVNLISATVAIASNFNRYQDRLRFTGANNIKGVFNTTTGILTLSGESSLANYQQALRSVKYENTYTSRPNTSDRKVEFIVYDGHAHSKVTSRTISFRPSAEISGGGDLCGSWQKATIVVSLTGRPNWKITIQRSGGPLPKDSTISNINTSPYKFASNLAGTYTLLNVSDKNFTTGTVSGTAVITNNLTPRAIISGAETACPGSEAVLNVHLEGTSPFSITYLCDGTNAKTVNNITETDYSLKVVGSGIYTLSAVSDPFRSGCVSGAGTVNDYPVPSGAISGSATICENTPTDLRVSLTGMAPWTFSYRKNAEIPTLIANVTSSPYYLSVSKPGTYTLVNVSDKNCTGTGSGSAVVTVRDAPEVSILGLLPAYKYDTGNILITGVPEGGTFTGHGIYTSEGKTYFFPSAAGIGVHKIIYTCQDPNTLCYGHDTVQVAVLLAEATLTLPNNDKRFYCFNDPPFTVRADNIENTTGYFSISGGVGLVDNRDNTATLYPSLFTQGGSYTISYSYQRQGVWMQVKENFEIEVATDIFFIDFTKTAYCDNENAVKLNGNMPNGVFSGRAVYGSVSTGYYFDPTKSSPGSDTVFYAYTTSRGCNLRIFKALTILDAPDINFAVPDSCIDSEGRDSTAFINLTTTPDIAEWLWDFNDNTQNTSMLKNPKHLYAGAGIRNVQLQARTSQNCVSKRGILFNFGDEPNADFKWTNECYHEGQPIEFINLSEIDVGKINFNKWEFISGTHSDSSLTQNASYIFDAPGDHEVILYVRSNYGCADTVRKLAPIRPTYEMQEETNYFEGFESGMAGWGTGTDTPGVNSWTLGEPHGDSLGRGFLYAKGGEKTWYTRFTPVQAYKEQSSYVTSPCYSFKGIRRPMIKFDIWRIFNYNRDGAVLQYTADSGKHWYNIGGLQDGINWYNAFDIEGNPGGYSFGWSNIQDRDWVEARHSLDKLNGMQDIQFRFAYGSDGTAKETYGLAFDNIWIGERNKTLLIEHFTSTNSGEARSADSILNRLANSHPWDIIDIQYHTSFPGIDPFNEQNQVDPRARASYYNVSTVPVSILSGGTESKFIFDYSTSERILDTALVKIEWLSDPLFSIRLQTIKLANSLDIVAQIRPLDTVLNRPIALHFAIIERKISGISGANGDTLFESVLKTLLPDTAFNEDWFPGQSVVSVSRNWKYKNTFNNDEVRVVAFLQDTYTREIFQAAIDQHDLSLAIQDDRTIQRSLTGTCFTVFPNPAQNEVCINFDEVTDKKARAVFFDLCGRLLKSCDLPPGASLYRIALEDCPDGLCFLQITSDNQFIGLQKLVIRR